MSRLSSLFVVITIFAAWSVGCGNSSTPSAPSAPPTAQLPGTTPPATPNGGGGGGNGGGGACSSNSGTCLLATGLQSPDALTQSGQWIYYGTENGSVVRLSKDGTQSQTLATGQGKIQRIQVDSSGVYWVGGQTLSVLPTGASAPKTIFNASNTLADLALDSNHAYVTSGATGNIYQVSKNGAQQATIVSGQSDTYGIATDGTAVYWTNANAGTINVTMIANGSNKVISTGQGNPVQIVLSATLGGPNPSNPQSVIYWVSTYAGSTDGPGVYSQSVFCGDATCSTIFGGNKQTLYGNNEPGPWALALDSLHLFWTNRVNGTVNEMMLDGTQVNILASGVKAPAAVASDGSQVYYATDSTPDGTISAVSP